MLFFVLHTSNQKTVATELILQAYPISSVSNVPIPQTPQSHAETPLWSHHHGLLLHLPHHRRLQRRLIGPHHLPNLLPALKNQKRRHRPNAQLLRNIRHLVDIEFVETGRFFVFLGHVDDGRGDDFAGAAPGGEAVEDHEGGVWEGGAEVGGAVGCVSRGGVEAGRLMKVEG